MKSKIIVYLYIAGDFYTTTDVTKENIVFKIHDDETGIKNYNVEINGKWMLFEYEYKKNELKYKFDSFFENKVENKMKVIIEDMVGNITEQKFSFYKK